MPIQHYQDLSIWKKGKEIALSVYRLTRDFPSDEKFGLINQIRRSAVSISSNIAEGFFRFSNRDFRKFLLIALGSRAELSTQLDLSKDLGFIPPRQFEKISNLIHHEMAMIRKLIEKIKL